MVHEQAQNGEEQLADVERTSQGIRDALFEELDAIRRGQSNPQKARAISQLSGTILATVRLEIDHAKYVSSLPTPSNGEDPGLPPTVTPLQLTPVH